MTVLSRRRFLAASAASAASAGTSAIAAQAPGDFDVVIIGAGAAGIAAARRLAGTRAKIVVVEAAGRLGGRCSTDTATFGAPFDRGAHWIHVPDLNPVTPLAMKSGFDTYPAPPSGRVRMGRRYARTGDPPSERKACWARRPDQHRQWRLALLLPFSLRAGELKQPTGLP